MKINIFTSDDKIKKDDLIDRVKNDHGILPDVIIFPEFEYILHPLKMCDKVIGLLDNQKYKGEDIDIFTYNYELFSMIRVYCKKNQNIRMQVHFYQLGNDGEHYDICINMNHDATMSGWPKDKAYFGNISESALLELL